MFRGHITPELEPGSLSAQRKQELLNEVLRSPALGRSEQLRQMLRYLVSEEIEGRGATLSEHAIGVEALGRSPNYSPETDSTVRTRAHELRRRLDDFYVEVPPGSWRIDLPKGTYQPRFVKVPPTAAAPRESAAVVFGRAFAFIAGVLVAGLVALGVWGAAKLGWLRSGPEKAAVAVWGPMLDRGSRVTVALSTPVQLWLRQFDPQTPPVNDPPFVLPVPADPRLAEWLAKQRPDMIGRHVLLHPNNHSPLWGEAAGAVAVAEFLAARSVHVELIGERNLRPAALKERNAIVIGRSEYNRAAQALQPTRSFEVRFVPGIREMAVVDGAGAVRFRKLDGGRTNFGVATFITRQTSQGPARSVLFSGINSDATQAAMEFMTSPHRLAELVREFQDRNRRVPDSFQVVVRTTSNDTQTLNAERVAIHVLDAN